MKTKLIGLLSSVVIAAAVIFGVVMLDRISDKLIAALNHVPTVAGKSSKNAVQGAINGFGDGIFDITIRNPIQAEIVAAKQAVQLARKVRDKVFHPHIGHHRL